MLELLCDIDGGLANLGRETILKEERWTLKGLADGGG